MDVTPNFRAFMVRVRAGDQDAARELVAQYGSIIRREVRLRLIDRQLLRVFDSMDIAQSVLNSFFSRMGAGQFEVETPEQLAGLLIGMARIKLAFQKRRHYARRRDSRMTAATRIDELHLAATTPGPCEQAVDNDLVESLRSRLSHEEREILALRSEGFEWSEVARRLGGSGQARRMQLARAVHRVACIFRTEEANG